MAKIRAMIKTEKARGELFSLMPAHEIALASWTFTQSYNIYIKGIEKALTKEQVTNSQWTALLVLFASKKAMSVTEINKFIPIESPSVSALLDKLEKRGLIKRRRSTKDRRVVNVLITEDGFELLKRIIPNLARFVEAAFKQLPTRELEALGSLSKKIRDSSLAFYGLTPTNAEIFLREITQTFAGH